MLRKFWLLFAQACTVSLAALFVVATLRPDLLPALGDNGRSDSVVTLQAPSSSGPSTSRRPESFAEAVEKAIPAVVNIYTSKGVRSRHPLLEDSLLRRYFPKLEDDAPRQRATSLGSGVIVSTDGYILTNHHVVEGADDIQVVLQDGKRLSAQVRGTDPESDLAVLKTSADNLPAITFGGLEGVRVGDFVLAIGNPFGFGNTVTSGIVSALGRNHLGVNRFEDFIQTDAAINPGNSGGALVDASGHLIGINSTIYSQSGGSMGIAFAIPVSIARNVLEQIIRDGEVTRGWFGLEPQDLTDNLARTMAVDPATGVVVRNVVRNGPADRAGLRIRDVVVAIDGKPVRDTAALLARIAELPPGTASRVKLVREKKFVEVEVTAGKRPRPQE
ncbi:MAG: trypsin-like peptidase domain-containing protein [Casimicrobiaceae bacterium]